jgi:CheY-like chemotaxis protein
MLRFMVNGAVAKRRIFLGDGDARGIRVFEAALVRAGFDVTLATSGQAALSAIRASAVPFDLLLLDAALPDVDGIAVVERAREAGMLPDIPVVMIGTAGVVARSQALSLGIEDWIPRPIVVADLLARVRSLVARRAVRSIEGALRAGRGGEKFQGVLAEVGAVDLLRVFDESRQSGIISLSINGVEGRIALRDGDIVTAALGTISGPEAVYRSFVWREGTYVIELCPVDEPDTVEAPMAELLLDGVRHAADWDAIVAGMPPLRQVFRVDEEALAERLGEIPDAIGSIVRLFDGARSLALIIDASPFEDISTLGTLSTLFDEGLLIPIAPPSRASMAPPSRLSWTPPAESRSPSEMPAPASVAVSSTPAPSATRPAAPSEPPDADMNAPIPLSRRSQPSSRESTRDSKQLVEHIRSLEEQTRGEDWDAPIPPDVEKTLPPGQVAPWRGAGQTASAIGTNSLDDVLVFRDSLSGPEERDSLSEPNDDEAMSSPEHRSLDEAFEAEKLDAESGESSEDGELVPGVSAGRKQQGSAGRLFAGVVLLAAVVAAGYLLYARRAASRSLPASSLVTAAPVVTTAPGLGVGASLPAPPSETAPEAEQSGAGAPSPSASARAGGSPNAAAGSGRSASSPAEPSLEGEAVMVDDDKGPLPVRVRKALEAGRKAKALTLALQLTSSAPSSASAWHMLGAAEQANGKSGAASYKRCAELAAPESQLANECRTLAGM